MSAGGSDVRAPGANSEAEERRQQGLGAVADDGGLQTRPTMGRGTLVGAERATDEPGRAEQSEAEERIAPRRRVIFLFLDGVGLGPSDPAVNPLAAGGYPTLERLLGGRALVAATGRLSTAQAELVPTDAGLGVKGRPQSATGQAAILTGLNAAQALGEHFGPRPDGRVRALLDRASVFRQLVQAGKAPFFCNAYPDRYFETIARGKRVLSAVPYAATVGGQRLLTHADLRAGRALAADYTNEGWRTELGYTDVPVFTPEEGGRFLWELAQPYDFVFFEHWHTDVAGHEQDLALGVRLLQRFDEFLGGLLAAADLAHTLIIVSSDHGNVEDCSHNKHTTNLAPALLLGAGREAAAARIGALTDFVGVIRAFVG